MSVENEDQCLVKKVQSMDEAPKKPRISYTRDFLLSLSELDVCKKLPEGFDPAVLGDFGEASNSATEWPRTPGNFSSLSYQLGGFGSSPPTRVESSNFSRGNHGRWDSRSSWSNDKDGDSNRDKDLDSGKRVGNQPRRPWQTPEHDGLLGSGAFPRPSGGYTTGSSAPKGRGDGQYQLNKSNEPYHPPRPYKAGPLARREISDSINDETFGSSECSNQDREEEERKRRASFELFRKESQKTYQEKKQQLPDKHSENYDPDIAALLKDSDSKLGNENGGQEDVAPPDSQDDSAISTQTPASRPLVPPGFKTSILEKNLISKSLLLHPTSEVGSTQIRNKINGISDTRGDKYPAKSIVSSTDTKEQTNRPSDVKVSENFVSSVHSSSNLLDVCGAQQDAVITGFDDEKVPGYDVTGKTDQERSTSILDKLFGVIANNDVKAVEPEGQMPYESSKFSLWFGEERKPLEDFSSEQPKDLLSLIVTAEKGTPQLSEVSDERISQVVQPTFAFKKDEPVDRFISSTTVEIHESQLHSNNHNATPRVLTCEDLEQSILSEISDNSLYPPNPVQTWGVMDPKLDQPKPEVNNLATQHILSLLQKGIGGKDSGLSPNLDVQSSENVHVYEGGPISTAMNSSQASPEVQNSEKTLTLETFFGSSFMKELQSVQAPVSVQRGPIGGTGRTEFSGPHEFPFQVADGGFRPPDISEYGSEKTTLEDDSSKSNLLQQTSNMPQNRMLGFDVHRNEGGFNPSAFGGFGSSVNRAAEIQLPQEESLITPGNAINPPNPMFMNIGNAAMPETVSSSTVPLDIVDKLAALNATLKDERSMGLGHAGPPFLGGPYNHLEPEVPYHNQWGQSSSPPFSHFQMNHGRSLGQPLDPHYAHINQQIMGPQRNIHHEPPHHQFPSNAFHHPSLQHALSGPTRFDPPAQNHMLQHMPGPGHFVPHHLLQGHPRGPPMPPHPIHHMAGRIPEADPMQGFHLHRQLSNGGQGVPLPGPGVGGSNHPEALGALFEMELRANAKQMRPVGPGSYGHEVDMGGFRYR